MPYKDKNSPAAKESQKRYAEKNRDKKNAYLKEYLKEYTKRDKDGKWRVYILPNELYVGQTSGVYNRMRTHRNKSKDTSDYIILHICDTKKEALELERIYHSLGFKGKHPSRR